MDNLNIVILSGGVSSRFWPLTQKNSFPFLGKTNIDLLVEKFGKIKPTKFFLVTGDNFDAKISGTTHLIQKGVGMAGGVKTALELINKNEEVLILNANDYYDTSLVGDFLSERANLKNNNEALIVGYKTKSYFPGGYLKLDGKYITEIVEKPGPKNTPSDYVNIVFHYFPTAVDLLNAINQSKSEKDDLYEVAMTKMITAGQMFKMLEYTGVWKTIKYPWHVLDVMDFFLASIKGQVISPLAKISPHAHIKGNVIIEEEVNIFEGAVINGPCYIGKNTIIANGALVRQSIIGEDCVIGFATEVARSYLKNNIWLHKNYVGDSIFDTNVSLGSNAVTGNLRLDEQNIKLKVKDELVDTKRNKIGAIIGPNVRIGINTSLMPGVRIGKGSFIGANVMLDADVEEKKFIKMEAKLVVKDNKFDITKTSRAEIKKSLS